MSSPPRAEVRLAEVIAALSLATDLGMGQPMEKALRTALLAVGLGAELGYDQPVLSDTYYLALLWHVGCTADAYDFSAWVGGDDIAFRSVSAALPSASMPETLRHMVDNVGKGRPFPQRLGLVTTMLVGGQQRFRKVVANHCDAAVILAHRLGLRPEVSIGLGQLFERWDGKGEPAGLGGDQLSPAFRVVQVAHDAEIFERLRGAHAATAVIMQRRGGAYDPVVCDAFVQAPALLAEFPTSSVWNDALQAEPPPQLCIPEPRLDELALAFAEFADLKSPFTLGHSSGVSRIADAAAQVLGWRASERAAVRRGALLHDLGRTGVPNGIWDKAGKLSSAEFERVRLHPYYTERILSQSRVLAPLASSAGAHHERLDGSGYHRGSGAGQLPLPARLIAAADVYQAMSQGRPHRPALVPEEARRQLMGEVETGRLDRTRVNALFEVGGLHPMPRQEWPAGLTEREVEVLRLLCRGLTNKQMAATVHIAEKTVGHHIEHIYDKIGRSSRAAAALFAMEHGLVE
jgi:HD-GYP domain-containing protein (c-di-GMP phosphodiesterase class II)/DNA-binding CsgD family transcriptional regulator